jgi:hypothetical protein
MGRIDRLDWTAGLSFICHGVRIGIRVNRPEILEAVTAVLPPGSYAVGTTDVDHLYSLRVTSHGRDGDVRGDHVLHAGPMLVTRTPKVSEALEQLESDLHLSVATRAPDRLFVHAGVVGWRGQAIVIPGRSFSGKSTLVAALLRAGAIYYSDEYAVLDAQGCVHPYLRPLTLRQGTDRPSLRLPAEALGGGVGTTALPVGLIAVSVYKEGARWRPRRLSPGRAMLELLAHTVPVRERPVAALATLSQAVASARAFGGVRGEAEPTARAILQQTEGGY